MKAITSLAALEIDPTGPSSTYINMRVTRICYFGDDPKYCRSADRWMEGTSFKNAGLGFRLAMTP